MAQPKSSKNVSEKSLKIPMMVGGSIIVVAIAATGFALLSTDEEKDGNANLESDGENSILEAVNYKDGTYVTEASYFVDASGKTDHIRVTVSVKDSKIESIRVDALEDGEVTVSKYMDEFNKKVNEKISGKKFSDVYGMELVSGSTLTSNSFKEALRVVEDKAED